LEQFLADLRAQALKAGLAAAYVCPDESRQEGFLIVAPDTLSAGQINGYFYWLTDQPAAGQAAAPLLLGLARLFSEPARDQAVAGRQYSEPAIVDLLAYSMQQILAEAYDPAMLDFILSCYRRDFEYRLTNPGKITEQNWTKTISEIEVIYHASVFSSVNFRILPRRAAG
jgi:hypothetical protein